MAQFDVYRLAAAPGLIVNCQSDFLDDLATRFVIPLSVDDREADLNVKFNPRFFIDGSAYVLMPQLAASLSRSLLRDPIASLARHEITIVRAIDLLLYGV